MVQCSAQPVTPLPAGRLQLIQSVLPQQVRALSRQHHHHHHTPALLWSGLVWSTDWNTIVTSSPTSSLTSVTTQIYQPEKLKYFLFFIALLRLLCWCSCLSQPTILNW